MAENQWKKPKDIAGNLEWKNGLSWRDVYFQVSTNTIYLYPKNRKEGNQILNTISITQVDEISENVGSKFQKSCFQMVLKTGIVEQFKCPALDGLNVCWWIDNLRHAVKFWTDKENLQLQKNKWRERRVTLERLDEATKCVNVKNHRVFFTLWNGEMIGLLVNVTSSFTDIYHRLFSLTCEPSSCSVCKIRHQSCDLWAVDTTGTARRAEKYEVLSSLDKAGNSLFVMEHHQKLLVVHFSDFSYEILPAPAAITAKEILKLDQIASKLNELGCLDPGLFLREKSGKELQFCMNDRPFKYQNDGKIVARSKIIRINSLKKSDYEKLAEMRWNRYLDFLKSQQTTDAIRESHADHIQKSCNMDVELCFVDDHFALNNDSTGRTANPGGIQAHNKHRVVEVNGGCQGQLFNGGNDLSPESSGAIVQRQLSYDPEWVSVLPGNGCAKNNTDVTNATMSANDVTSVHSPGRNQNEKDYDFVRREYMENDSTQNNNDGFTKKDLADPGYGENNPDLTNEISSGTSSKNNSDAASFAESTTRSDSSNCSIGKENKDTTNMASSHGTSSKNNDEITVASSDGKHDVTGNEIPDHVITSTPASRDCVGHHNDVITSDSTCVTSNNDITSLKNVVCDENDIRNKVICPKNSGDVTNMTDSNYGKSNNDVTNNANLICAENSNDDTNVICAENSNDVTNKPNVNCSQNRDDVTNMTDSNYGKSNNDVTNNANLICAENSIDDTNVICAENSNDVTNKPNVNCSQNRDDVTNMTDSNCTENKDDVTNVTDSNCAENNNDVTNKANVISAENSDDVTNMVNDTNCRSSDHKNNSSEPNADTFTDVGSVRSPSNSTSSAKPFIPSEKRVSRIRSDGSVFQTERQLLFKLDHSAENRFGMRRCLSDLNVRYSLTTVKMRRLRSESEPNLLDSDDEAVVRVSDVFVPKESSDESDHSEDDVRSRGKVSSTFNGPTWMFAKRVEECVRKILDVQKDTSAVERMIAEHLSNVLFELLNHGLKRNFLGISFFSKASNVWDICQSVCKVTNVGVGVIGRIREGSIDEKFHRFIHECIRHKILSRWFEVLSSERAQKRIMKHYESNAVVLEPEHSKAMEHLKLYLDRLSVLKLKALKSRESRQNKDFLYSFE